MPTRKLLYFNEDYGFPSEVAATDAVVAGMFVAKGVGGVAVDAGGFRVTNLPEPASAGEPVTKAMFERLQQGVTQIPSVRVLASGNQALTGLPSIDGVQLVAGDRVLLTAQNNAVTNGVWEVATAQWTRPTASGVSDWLVGRNASSLSMFVREGRNYADLGYTCVSDNNPIIGTDPVAFTQYTGLGEVMTGLGLAKSTDSGNTISAVLAAASGLQFSGSAIDTLLAPAGALTKSADGLAIKPSTDGTVAVDATGLKTRGLPVLFTVGGAAVSDKVTAPSLSALTGGPASLADALHQHTNVLGAQTCAAVHQLGSTGVQAGDPVQWSSTANQLMRSQATDPGSAQCIGVAAATIGANGTGTIVKRGIAAGVLTQATPGAVYYIGATGGLSAQFPPTGTVVRVGIAASATDLDVQPAFVLSR